MCLAGGLGMPFGGYGYGNAFPGAAPAPIGAITSSASTPFEHVSGELSQTKAGISGALMGGGIGAGAGGLAGVLLGAKFGGKKGAALGGVLGALGGAVGGIFLGKEISQGNAAIHDIRDNGKGDGSTSSSFNSSLSYGTGVSSGGIF